MHFAARVQPVVSACAPLPSAFIANSSSGACVRS